MPDLKSSSSFFLRTGTASIDQRRLSRDPSQDLQETPDGAGIAEFVHRELRWQALPENPTQH